MDDTRLKRLRMRSWRRGTKEMDLILGRFADTRLSGLDAGTLDIYETLLGESDQDLYDWVAGRAAPPQDYVLIVAEIARATDGRT